MKKCPTCGRPGEDDDVFCEIDGAKLVGDTPGKAPASAAPAPAALMIRCTGCGAMNPEGGDGYCAECGHKLATRTTLPGTVPKRIGDYNVTRGYSEGDLIVNDDAGASRLLLFGQAEAIRLEAAALAAPGLPAAFPKVIAQGEAPGVGSYLVVDRAVDRGSTLSAARLSLPSALAWARALLDAIAALAAAGFWWDPSTSDLRASADGSLEVTRVRKARRLAPGEIVSAKRALEAAGAALVPTPLCLTTPALVRLFLPRSNFSTPATATIEEARDELTRAEVAMRARGPRLAAVCDPGLRKAHNEDAVALVEGEIGGETYTILVVCDGVSSSTHAEQASTVAARVTRDALSHFARSGDILREGASSAVAAAIRAAHVAVCAWQIEFGAGAPPGTTIVAALVFRKNLTVGWVGDSRAYWVAEQGAELCTTDHSWVNEAVARGEVSMAEALVSPLAHALTKCLGPLENDPGTVQEIDPGIRSKALPGPGRLVLCTDGLWNYFPGAPAIASLVHASGKDADPAAICRSLVCHALAQGGGDNVSVALLDVK